MIDSSLQYKQEIRENSKFSIYADIYYADDTHEKIYGDRFVEGTVSFDDSTSSSSTFEIGSAIINTFSCSLNNRDEHFNDRDFTGAVIIPVLVKPLSNGTNEVIKKGYYNVEQPSVYGDTINLTCYDNMTKFEKPLSSFQSEWGDITALRLLQFVCNKCNVTLSSDSIDFPNANLELTEPQNFTAMTCLSVVSAIAQISGRYARIGTDGQLHLKWYDNDIFRNMRSGGTFKTKTTPYSDGASLNGGTFNTSTTPYSDGDNFDGGSFFDKGAYSLYAFKSFEMCTDDVIVTGIRATIDDKTYTYGTEGYMLDISNDFLTADNVQGKPGTPGILQVVGDQIIGIMFRPFNCSAMGDPTLEAGDSVYLLRGDVPYGAYVTHVNFKIGGYSNIECTAETPNRNSASSYSAKTVAYVKAREEAKIELTSYQKAVQDLTTMMYGAMGLYRTEEVDPYDENKIIYYMHNKPAIADSSTIWKLTADAWAVSTDGGKTYSSGWQSDGTVVAKMLNVVGINADWINTGELNADRIRATVISAINSSTGLTIDTNKLNLNGYITATNLGTAGQTTINGGNITTGTITVGGSNGSIVVKNANGNTLITLDRNGITFASGCQIKYSDVSGTPDLSEVAYQDDIPDSITDFSDATSFCTKITENTVSAEYIYGKNVTARKLEATEGHIAGWSIDSADLYCVTSDDGKDRRMAKLRKYQGRDDNFAFDVGYSVDYGNTWDFPFFVRYNGEVYMRNANVVGGTLWLSDNNNTGQIYCGNNGAFIKSSLDSANIVISSIETYNDGGGYTGNIQSNGNLGCTGTFHATGYATFDNGLTSHSGVTVHGTVYADYYDYNSDARLKHDISPLEKDFNSLIDVLEPKTYRFNSNDKEQIGFIAQEILECLDEKDLHNYGLVNQRDDGYYTVSYNNLIPILWQGLQDSRKRISELEEKVDFLMNQLKGENN